MQASDYKRILEDRKIRLCQLSEPEAPNGWYWRLDSTLWNGPYLQEHEAFQAMLDYLLVNTGIGVKVQQLVMSQQQVQGISVEQLHQINSTA
jgi:hypothetical protein